MALSRSVVVVLLLVVGLTPHLAYSSEVEFRIIEIDPKICPHLIIKRTDVNEGRFFYVPRVTLALDRFNRTYLFDVWNQQNGDRVYSFKFLFLGLDDVDEAAEVFDRQCNKDLLMKTLRDRGEIPREINDDQLNSFTPGPIIPSAIQIRVPTEYQSYVMETPNATLDNDLITFVHSSPITLLMRIPPEKQIDFDTALTSHGGIPIGIRLRFSTRVLAGFLNVSLDVKDVYTWIKANLKSGEAIPWAEVQGSFTYAVQEQRITYKIFRVGDIPDDKLGSGQITELVDKILTKHLAKEFGTNDPNATQPGGVPLGTLPKYFVFKLDSEHIDVSRKVSFQLTNLSADQVDQWALMPYDLSIHSSILDGVRQLMVEYKNFGDNAQYSHFDVKKGDLIQVNVFDAWTKNPKRSVTEEWLTKKMFEGPALDSNDFIDENTELRLSRYVGQAPKIWEYLREDGDEDDNGELYTRYGTSNWFWWMGVNHYKKFKIRKLTYADPDKDPDIAFEFKKIDIPQRYRESWLVPLGIRIGAGQMITIRDYVRGRESEIGYAYDPRTNVMSFRADKNGHLYFGNLEAPVKRDRALREFSTVVFNGMWEKMFGSDTIDRERLHEAYTTQGKIEYRSLFAFQVQMFPKGMENLSSIEQNLEKKKKIQNGTQ